MPTPKTTERKEIIEDLLYAEAREKKLCEDSYYFFFKRAWAVLDPETPLVDNWHIRYICDLLQFEIERIAAKKIKTGDIICNVMPRSAKSMLWSVLLCPWTWIKYPYFKFINSSYSDKLSTYHCVEGRRIIESDWYQRKWADRFALCTDQNVKGHYENTARGIRMATSVGGSITGFGAHVIIIDDPQNPKEAHSEAARVAAIDHYEKDLYSRLNDQRIGFRGIVMQRVHDDDLVGHLMKKAPNKYRTIILPAEYDEEIVSPPELQSKYKDGVFFPKRFPAEVLQEIKDGMSDLDFACQYGQRPAVAGGTIIKREWFGEYDALPEDFDEKIQTWDLAFKGKQTSDFVVGSIWGKKGAKTYLVDRFRGRVNFPKTLEQFRLMAVQYEDYVEKIVEDKANGPALIATLEDEIPGIVPQDPGDKDIVARINAISPILKAGNIVLPNPALHKWVYEFLDECCMVPNGKNDDQVITLVMAVERLYASSLSRLERLVEGL